MKRGDRESKTYMSIDDMHEQLRSYREQELRVEVPPAASMCGQSVLRWWALWMKDAPETLWYYSRKNRPAWFSAEITSYCHYGDIKYVGQTMRAHHYHVYSWNGQRETIPEPCLMKRKADSSANLSAVRVLHDSGLMEPDFWEHFNTRGSSSARAASDGAEFRALSHRGL